MPHIPLDENLPGITGLLNYRQDTALPIRQLTQILLRGESTLTEGERELIATATSQGNQCKFCTAALFCLYNKYVDGLASVTPTEPAFYERLAGILKTKGYMPSPDRYAELNEAK